MSFQNTIRIKCPNCGAILTVPDSPANVGKSVKCPICKEKYAFTEFKEVKTPEVDADRTSFGLNVSSKDMTQLPQIPKSVTIGHLVDESRHRQYKLTEGINLIGRKTYQTASLASIQIETDDLGFSRKHLYIEAAICPDGHVLHYAYNASNKNVTLINGIPLGAGDKVILHNSDVIHSANTTLTFKVPENSFPDNPNDLDKTQI